MDLSGQFATHDMAGGVVLVHSPLVGPLSWRAVGAELVAAGRSAIVPSLTEALGAGPPYHARIADAVARAVDSIQTSIVLVGHSGAGPLLPSIAAAVKAPVDTLLFVDAGLPRPSRSWFDDAPADLADHLRLLANDDVLPPWHEWFGPDALDELLPDQQLRQQFTAEVARLPLAFLREHAPSTVWSGTFGYLLLSDGYVEAAERARALGATVITRMSDHLAMLTQPRMVAQALLDLLAARG